MLPIAMLASAAVSTLGAVASSATSSRPQAATSGSPSSPAAMRKAAQSFEAQALGALLQPAFAAADPSRSAFGGGGAEAQWRPMLVDAVAGSAARAGGVGLGAMVLREMLRMQAAAPTAGGSRGAGSAP
jgi:Rod binding domain-containing protein